MKESYPLISVLVLCYNNQKYLYDNLKSIFSQTYPNIEVLISDDASDDFNASILINWIAKNKTFNIKKISIYENQFNIGTVASLENLQKKSEGEFLFNIAADDVFFDNDVLLSLYKKAKEVGDDAQVILAEVEMWDEKLENKIGCFLKEEGLEKIKNSTALDLFSECSWHPFLPACYLYHRNLLDIIGDLSQKYSLIEDWPSQIIFCREGIKPVLCDIKSTIKHRDGGISHGNSLDSKLAFLRYYHDFYQVYINEVEPFISRLSVKDGKRAKGYATDRFRAYYKIHLPKVMNLISKSKEVVKVVEKISTPIMQEYSYSNKFRRIALKLSDKKNIIYYILVFIAVICVSVFAYVNYYRDLTIILMFLLGNMCCFVFSMIILYFGWRKHQ